MQTVVAARPMAPGPNLGFASAVAELGLLLTGSPHRAGGSVERVAARARPLSDR